jgi:hypothetical protein
MTDRKGRRVTRALQVPQEATERQDRLVSEAQEVRRGQLDQQGKKAMQALKASQVPKD